jgi:alanine racemase
MAMPNIRFSTWLEIDLSAIQNNIRQIQARTGRPVMPVIKANGYGHGIVDVARAAVEIGTTWLAVARLEEALALRTGGIDQHLLVLGYCAPERVPEALANRISLTVYHPEIGAAYAAQAQAAGGILSVHLKIDSGMGRLGIFAEDGFEFVRAMKAYPSLHIEGLFTHMARADEPTAETTHWQLERFGGLVKALEAAGLRPGLVHAANSACLLYFPNSYFDLVRPGIAIYGLHPDKPAPLPEGFVPALSWKARLISVKELPAGHGVGYNYRYTTSGTERIGVVAVGYADGFRRRLGNFALVGGKRVKVAGGVCMDQCMLQLDEVPTAQAGDEVVLLGRQGNEMISAEEIGATWNTTNYEVVCGLAARVPRIYRS